MGAGVGEAFELLLFDEADLNATGAALLEDALQLDVITLARHGDIMHAFGARFQCLFDGMDAVDGVHSLVFSGRWPVVSVNQGRLCDCVKDDFFNPPGGSSNPMSKIVLRPSHNRT